MNHGNQSEKEQIAQLVLNNVLDGIITIDKHAIVESYNPSAERIFGYTYDEVVGKNIDMLMPEPYHSQHDTYMKNYLSTGKKKIIGIGREVVGKRKDGSTFPMDLAVTEFMINGESHFVGIVQDITKRKDTEKALRKALRDDFSHTVKNLQNLVFKYKRDKNGHFVYTLSEGLLAQELDIMSKKLIGKSPKDIFPEPLASELENYYEQSYKGEHTVFEMGYGGKTLYIVLSPVISQGKVREVVGSGVDITDRKKMESALELTRDQALEASELKLQFLANMSHEVRTPMNGIIGVTELMYDTEMDKEQHDFINIIRDSAQSLLTIINDILDFSKMEAGKMRIDQTDFSMPSLVEGVSEILVSKAYSKELSLLTFIDPTIPTRLHGDPVRLRQVVLNLTDNAIKFTSEGSVVVRAILGDIKGHSVTIQFAVIDTGIGISSEEQSRLFQPFVQADGSTTRKFGGTGLGLAISKRLVELMGGEMGVESEVGQGTTFWFNIPFEIAESESYQNPLDIGVQLESLRVLIVNDDTMVSDILKQYLDSWGMANHIAKNGIDALTLLKEQAVNGRPYDIALVHLEKTGLDSMTFATVVQKDPDLAVTKLIYITGFDEKKVTEKALHVGYSAFIKQPVKQSYLLDCFASIVNQGMPVLDDIPDDNSKSEDSNEEPIRGDVLILLVEDNPVNRKVAQYQLKKLGYPVEVANNGVEALQKLGKTSYSLILMDIQMPQMDGVETTKHIRALEEEKRITPIIAMTANAMQSDKDRYLASGIDDYLSKPVKMEKLKYTIEKWLPQVEMAETNMTDQQDQQFNQQLPIDIIKLQNVYGSDKYVIKDFVDVFLKSTVELLKQLEESIQGYDDITTAELAHGLKGASAVIEAHYFSALSKRLEHQAKQKKWDSISNTFIELKQAFSDIETYIHNQL